MDEVRSRLAAWWAQAQVGPVGPAIARAGRGARRLRAELRSTGHELRTALRRAYAPVRPAVDATSDAARRASAAARPGTPPILYRDGMVTLDHEGVVVSGYFLPFGRRRIRYDEIHEVAEHALTGGRQFRVHGFSWPRYWYHRDARRAERAFGLELRTDGLLHPVLTPAEVDRVKALIVEGMAAARPDGDGT